MILWYRKTSAMYTHNMFNNRKPYAHAMVISIPCSVNSIEFFFYKTNITLRYANTIIMKSKFDWFFIFLICTYKMSIYTCIFDKIREYIMNYLYVHRLIHTYRCISWHIYNNRLIIFTTLREIFLYKGLNTFLNTESFNTYCFFSWMRSAFEF